MADAPKVYTTLKGISLSPSAPLDSPPGNGVGDNGAASIAAVLRANPCGALVEVNLSKN